MSIKKTAWEIEQARIAQQTYLFGVHPPASPIETARHLGQLELLCGAMVASLGFGLAQGLADIALGHKLRRTS